MVVGVWGQMRQVRRLEARMQQAELYLPIATNLALYCQSSESLQLEGTIGAARLPQPLPALGASWASFFTNYAHVEFGGGFYHYGYRVQREEASDPETNLWRLYLFREGTDQKLLHRFALAAATRLSGAAFVSNSIAEYDRRLAKSPEDIRLHQAKISLLAQYSPEAVPVACLDAVKALPRHWWPRLTLALVDTGRGEPSEASHELVKFVESRPGYSRYLYLSYFYQLNGKPKAAAQAIEKAISFPILDLEEDETNSECRGYAAGVYLYQNQEYSTVIKLCDALFPIRENGGYAKAALQSLRSAAESAAAGSNVEFAPSEAILRFDPYEKIDIKVLLGK
jgi:hypothetical protein